MSSKHERIQASAMEAESTDNLIIQENNAKLIEKSMNSEILVALEKIGLKAEGYAKQLCPVDTGRLRNSIIHVIDDDENAVYIGTNVEYGKHVEFGTSRQKAQPFLKPAAERYGAEYARIIEARLKG